MYYVVETSKKRNTTMILNNGKGFNDYYEAKICLHEATTKNEKYWESFAITILKVSRKHGLEVF